MITEFKTLEESLAFAYKHMKTLSLSYVPEEDRKDILDDAMSSVHFDIIFNHVSWASSDIMYEVEKQVGYNLLRYLEYKAKNIEV